MTRNYRWIGAVVIAVALCQAAAPAEAQFYGGGYWGGGGGTVAGNALQGAGMAAMGAGRYNVDTAQARAINAETALQWNQYMYQAKVEGERIYNERMARDQKRSQENIKAHEARLRTAPNEYDITTGNALNA